MLRLALRSVLARWPRLLLTALAIVASTSFLSGTFVFRDTIERTFDGERQRSFTATELTAFARCFGKPVGWFFIPPPSLGRRWVDPIEGSSWMRAHDLLGLILGDPSGWQSFVERISELLSTDSSEPIRQNIVTQKSPVEVNSLEKSGVAMAPSKLFGTETRNLSLTSN